MDRVQTISKHIAPEPVAAHPGHYEYTVNHNGALSEEQRSFYEKNGFLVIKGLVPKDDLERYIAHFLKISSGEVKPTMTMTVMRDVALAKNGDKKKMGEQAITKLQDWQEDPVLFDYCSLPQTLRYVASIIGPSANSVHTMLINKPPDVGIGSSRHPPHQDLWYFPFRPAEKIVCAWTAMEDIDNENGCLFVKPGSHTTELFHHGYPTDGLVNKMYHGIQGLANETHEEGMTKLHMKMGDTVFFHPLLIHGSGRNRSNRFRKAISCHYASSDCNFINVTGTMQEDIAKEVEAIAKRRTGGGEVHFNEIWRFKSRLVLGNEGAFHAE